MPKFRVEVSDSEDVLRTYLVDAADVHAAEYITFNAALDDVFSVSAEEIKNDEVIDELDFDGEFSEKDLV
jgi:hypothetical protein